MTSLRSVAAAAAPANKNHRPAPRAPPRLQRSLSDSWCSSIMMREVVPPPLCHPTAERPRPSWDNIVATEDSSWRTRSPSSTSSRSDARIACRNRGGAAWNRRRQQQRSRSASEDDTGNATLRRSTGVVVRLLQDDAVEAPILHAATSAAASEEEPSSSDNRCGPVVLDVPHQTREIVLCDLCSTVSFVNGSVRHCTKCATDLKDMLFHGQDDRAMAVIEQYPLLCRQPLKMVFQGLPTQALPVHAALLGPVLPSISVLEALVTHHPAALLQGDSVCGRTPLHMALGKCKSQLALRLLVEAQPRALSVQDMNGNLPLHAATLLAQPRAILELVLDKFPQGCSQANSSGKLPLHLYCGQGWISNTTFDTQMLQRLITCCPSSVRHKDREGLLPLHIVCGNPNPRWDVVSILVEADPTTVLERTKGNLTPLQLLKRRSTTFPDNHVVLAMLQDRSVKERRRQGQRRVSKIILFRRKAKMKVDLYNCYG